jgi:hypothetical protein
MKYIIALFLIASLSCIIGGILFELPYSEQLIGSGIVGLFFIVFPLFSWYRWKDRNVKDYLLNQENLEKMRKYKEDN